MSALVGACIVSTPYTGKPLVEGSSRSSGRTGRFVSTPYTGKPLVEGEAPDEITMRFRYLRRFFAVGPGRGGACRPRSALLPRFLGRFRELARPPF